MNAREIEIQERFNWYTVEAEIALARFKLVYQAFNRAWGPL